MRCNFCYPVSLFLREPMENNLRHPTPFAYSRKVIIFKFHSKWNFTWQNSSISQVYTWTYLIHNFIYNNTKLQSFPRKKSDRKLESINFCSPNWWRLQREFSVAVRKKYRSEVSSLYVPSFQDGFYIFSNEDKLRDAVDTKGKSQTKVLIRFPLK